MSSDNWLLGEREDLTREAETGEQEQRNTRAKGVTIRLLKNL